MTMAFPAGRFVWFEYVSKDIDKAKSFFGELFHWKTKSMPVPQAGDYTMITIGDQSIGGYMPTPQGAPPQAHWLSVLQVEDARATAAKITSLGGKVLKEPAKMGDMATWAIVADPAGAAFELWQPTKPEPSEFKDLAGAWCWNELWTSDPAKAITFYLQLGFDGEGKMETPTGAYHLLKSAGKDRAGVMKQMKPGPAMWTPYVQVADTDRTVDHAKRLGATVLMPGESVPNVGRIAVLADPQGAPIGLLQPTR
jgi:predicted enzyme related to lactoylglutathione lyase